MVTFIHDHIFYKDQGDYFTSGSLSPTILKRYIDIFGDLRMVTRCKERKMLNSLCDASNIEHTTFVEVPDFLRLSGLLNYIKACKIIKEEVRAAQYIILRNGIFAIIASRYAQKYHKPFLVEVVSCTWDAYWNHSTMGKIIAPFLTLFTRRMVRRASHVVYVTEEFLQRRYPTKGRQIAVSDVALTGFDETVLEKRLQRINRHTGTIVLGTTAAVNVRYKGQQYVIEALGQLKQQGITNYEYQLVGGGDQSYLKGVAQKYGVEDQIKFLGPLPHDKVFEWLDTIDLYVQPSRQEGLPRALIEAMSRAVPAFAAKTGGIPELLDAPLLFSNNHNNIAEICNILHSFTKEKMCETATQNFKQAKKYDKHIIDKKRGSFFKEFIETK